MKFVFVALVLIFSTPLWAKPQIKVRAMNLVKASEELRLGHIAEFHQISLNTQKALSRIALGHLPAVGEKRVFDSATLSQIFRNHLSAEDRRGIQLKIPSQVVIKNPGDELSDEILRSELENQWRAICKNCRFSINTLSLPRLPESLQGRPWQLIPRTELPKGGFTAQLRLRGDHGREHIYWVNGHALVFKRVPVVKGSLPIGHRLQKKDVELTFKDVTFATDSAASEEDYLGRRLKRSLRAKDIVFSGVIERERALRRGDVIKAWAGGEKFQITLMGVAEQDGFVGDRIRFKNRSSKKTLMGKVIAKGEVRVE